MSTNVTQGRVGPTPGLGTEPLAAASPSTPLSPSLEPGRPPTQMKGLLVVRSFVRKCALRCALGFVGIDQRLRQLAASGRTRGLKSGGGLSVGRHTYGCPEVLSFDTDPPVRIVIGSYCSIGPRVLVIPGGIHPTQWISTYPFTHMWQLPDLAPRHYPRSKGDVVVGNDVWIGTGAILLSGARIGDGGVISAGSVVSGRVPPYAVFGGNPAQLLYYRFSQERIKRLRRIRWWDWEESRIRQEIPLLLSDRVDEFLDRWDPSRTAVS
jgi:acetyltransferase-like isoleucine patch superfamily enzyme